MKTLVRTTLAAVVLSIVLSGCVDPTSSTLAAESTPARGITTSQTGWHGGYWYSFWTNGGGWVSMDLGSNGNYAMNWSNCGNFTGGKGWRWGTNRTIHYNAGHWAPSGNGMLAVYGWTTNPLIEYYIVDTWGDWRPTYEYVNSVWSDGAWYDIYRHWQSKQPSILGPSDSFWQYWSVRQSKRPTGSNVKVTTANHFNAWRDNGMHLGSHDYQILSTEGYRSSGAMNATVW